MWAQYMPQACGHRSLRTSSGFIGWGQPPRPHPRPRLPQSKVQQAGPAAPSPQWDHSLGNDVASTHVALELRPRGLRGTPLSVTDRLGRMPLHAWGPPSRVFGGAAAAAESVCVFFFFFKNFRHSTELPEFRWEMKEPRSLFWLVFKLKAPSSSTA